MWSTRHCSMLIQVGRYSLHNEDVATGPSPARRMMHLNRIEYTTYPHIVNGEYVVYWHCSMLIQVGRYSLHNEDVATVPSAARRMMHLNRIEYTTYPHIVNGEYVVYWHCSMLIQVGRYSLHNEDVATVPSAARRMMHLNRIEYTTYPHIVNGEYVVYWHCSMLIQVGRYSLHNEDVATVPSAARRMMHLNRIAYTTYSHIVNGEYVVYSALFNAYPSQVSQIWYD